MDMCDESSAHRDLAISTKLGRGFHCCVLGLPDSFLPSGWKWSMNSPQGQWWWASPISYCRSPKKPWGWALLFLLQLCSLVASGSTGSEGLDEVIFTKCNGTSLVRTSSSLNDVSSYMDSLNSHTHSVNWHDWLVGAVGPFLPRSVMPWHTPRSSGAALSDSSVH